MSGYENRNITLEEMKIKFKNFAGEKSQYNVAGNRTFNVILPEEVAEDLIANGWTSVKNKPSEMYPDEPNYSMPIKVHYGDNVKTHPRVYMVTEGENGQRNVKPLREDELWALDAANIISCDMEIRPYDWELAKRPDGTIPSGRAAYLVKLYANIFQSKLDSKYAEYDS